MTPYLDTSALIKLLVAETGSDVAREVVTRGERRFTSALAYVEVRSALARMRRGDRLTARQREASVDALEDLWRGFDRVEVDSPLIESAADVADHHGLRAYDAVHLASAILTAAEIPIVFACWDAELRQAAAAEGLALVPS